MKLAELDPRWLLKDGARVGFIFISPTQRKRHDGTPPPMPCLQTCFVSSPSFREQCRIIGDTMNFDSEEYEDGRPNIQSCTPGVEWAIAGGIENADFASLTVTPSIDGSRGGNWHGFITNGEIVRGLS